MKKEAIGKWKVVSSIDKGKMIEEKALHDAEVKAPIDAPKKMGNMFSVLPQVSEDIQWPSLIVEAILCSKANSPNNIAVAHDVDSETNDLSISYL